MRPVSCRTPLLRDSRECAIVPMMSRVRRVLALTLAVSFLLAPSAARAASVSVDGDVLRVTAAPGEYNAMSVLPAAPPAAPGTLTVTDVGVAPTPGPGCAVAVGSSSLACVGVGRVEINLGDGDDRLDLTALLPGSVLGGPGNDVLTLVAPSLL